VSYTSLAFQLTDLDPTDGVVPSLTWKDGGAFSVVRSHPSPLEDETDAGDSKLGIFVSTHATLGLSEARTLPDSAFSFISTSGTVGLRAETSINQYFALSAHTKVTASALGHAEFAGTDRFYGKAASGQLILSFPLGEFNSDFVHLEGDGSSNKAMSVSISNTSDGVLSQYGFTFYTAVQLNGNLPVPEPGVLVLLVIGVLTAGAVVKVRAAAARRS